MERESLERFLAAGLSLAAIGERVGKDPSTVGYWVQKHGLAAVHRDRHAPRGGLAREQLEPLVGAGASMRQIAETLDVSLGTVRHWLRTYGLRTNGVRHDGAETNAAKADGRAVIERECRHHGMTEFFLEGRGYYRCLRCRSEAVARRRRKVKTILVAEAGGRCGVCGYDRYVGALQFHHRDPDQKTFGVAERGMARSLDRMRAEARKCVLLCSNCHAELEGGALALPV